MITMQIRLNKSNVEYFSSIGIDSSTAINDWIEEKINDTPLMVINEDHTLSKVKEIPNNSDILMMLSHIRMHTTFIVESIKEKGNVGSKNTDLWQKGHFDNTWLQGDCRDGELADYTKSPTISLTEKQKSFGVAMIAQILASRSDEWDWNMGDYWTKNIEEVIPQNITWELRSYISRWVKDELSM